MENKKYFEECEEIGNKLFLTWANQTKYFKKMERQPLLSRVDWVCESNNGIIVNCELKVRNTLKYSTIFIEPGKYSNLIKLWNDKGIIPLYLNFSGNECIAFDLRKCKVNNVGEVRIWDGSNKCYTMVNRFSLNVEDGVKYINGCKVK